jgi:hypothetical protein
MLLHCTFSDVLSLCITIISFPLGRLRLHVFQFSIEFSVSSLDPDKAQIFWRSNSRSHLLSVLNLFYSHVISSDVSFGWA